MYEYGVIMDSRDHLITKMRFSGSDKPTNKEVVGAFREFAIAHLPSHFHTFEVRAILCNAHIFSNTWTLYTALDPIIYLARYREKNKTKRISITFDCKQSNKQSETQVS